MMKIAKIVESANALTHGGVFHADEVMGTVILSKLFDNLTVARVFALPQDCSEDVIIYDIGCGELDHHQQGGNGYRENGVPYAACGLIWRKYGHMIAKNPSVWEIVDRELIQGIDAGDNGAFPKSNYPAKKLSFSGIIAGMNPNWDSDEDADDAFVKAVSFAETIFDMVLSNANAKVKAQSIVAEAINASDGHIMILDQFVPWQDFLFASENEKAREIQFVVFPSNRGGYNWQCVPDAPGSFGQRKPVPTQWKGLRDGALQEVTGVETATFCHPAGFIGGASTLEGAIALAKIAACRKIR